MVGAVVIIALLLIVAGIVVIAIFAARGGTLAKVPAAAQAFIPIRRYPEPLASSTGTVEVAKPAPAPAPAPPLFDLELDADAEPGPVDSAPDAEIRWCKQFDPRSGALDPTARLRLIGDLGVVAKEWCVSLLCRAYEEERRPANRQAALISLAACRSRTAIPTYRLALASGDPEERAIAADALADLEPPVKHTPRTVVERY